jgi:hypothetical protein
VMVEMRTECCWTRRRCWQDLQGWGGMELEISSAGVPPAVREVRSWMYTSTWGEQRQTSTSGRFAREGQEE